MYFLHVYAESSEVPADTPAVGLYRADTEPPTLMASSDTGVSLADIEGVPVADLLSQRPPEISRKAWLRKAGMALYQRLASPDIDSALRALDSGSVTLIPRSPSLASVPWEILRRVGSPHPLFCDSNVPWLCGSADTRVYTTPVGDEWPLRMLVVVGSKPDDERVQALDESYALEELARGYSGYGSARAGATSGASSAGATGPESLAEAPVRTRGDVLLNFLFQPTLDHLAHTLQTFKPHIFHFIGHGRIKDGEPELRVYSEGDRSYHPWGYDQITTAFDLKAVPRLVYLDACHSGFDDPDAWSLTEGFREIGVGAVLSMQREILGSTAVECARAFYTDLFGGRTVASAAASARRSLIAGSQDAEWYVPRLWVRGDPAKSVTLPRSPSVTGRDDLLRCPRLGERLCFVGRWPQRYLAWKGVPAARESGLLVVHGAPESGRTSFVQLLMEMRALTGSAIHYVDFRGIGGDYLTILDRILALRTTDGQCSYIRAPLSEGGFRKFVELRPSGAQRTDNALVGNMRKRLMTAFWNGLSASTAERPLLLVLDHLEPSHFHNDVVCKHIAYELLHDYRPASTRATVETIMVLDEQQTDVVRKHPYHVDPPFIEVREFSAKERDYYMPLYFNWRKLPDPQAAERMRKFIVDFQIPCPAGFERAEGLLALVRRNEA